jgi:multidrug efflux pump subunit AcrB
MKALAGWPARHPVAAPLILIALALVAAVLSPRLRLERVPLPAGTGLHVQVRLPGLVPQQIEQLLARPLEEALHTLPDLRELIVYSSDGQARLELGFDSTAARERALDEVRRRIADAAAHWPAGVESPVVERADPSLRPAAIYAIVADPRAEDISRWAERQLRRPLHELAETTAAELDGVDTFEIVVRPDPRRLVALGLSFDDVIQALRGSDQAPHRQRTRRAATTLPTSAEAIAVRALRLPSGEPIALAEVAEVALARRAAAHNPTYEGKPALLLRVYPRTPAEAAQVADRVDAHLAWLQANGLVPAEAKMHKLFDESDESSRWLRRVLRRIGVTVALTLAAVGLFFGMRAVVTISAAFAVWLPVSAAVLWAAGLALNVMTVAGIMFGCLALTLMTLRSTIVPACVVLAFAALLGARFDAAAALAPALAALGTVVLAAVPVAWLLSARRKEPHVALLARWLPPAWRTQTVSLLSMSVLLVAAFGFGVRTLPTAVADVSGGAMRVQLRGEDEERVSLLAGDVLTRLRSIEGVSNISHSGEPVTRWRLQVDADKLAEAQIDMTTVARHFEIARNGLIVGELIDADVTLALRLQLAPGATGNVFERLPLRGERKNQPALYLRDVGVAERVTGARERVRVQRQPAVDIRARWSAPAMPAALQRATQSLALPPGYSLRLETSPTAEAIARP